MTGDEREAANGEVDYAIEAFDKYVRSMPNDAGHFVLGGLGMTGKQLHIVRQWMEDMSTGSDVGTDVQPS